MSINLSEIIEQRAEATGVDGDRVPFEFGGKTFTFKDPMMLSEDDKDELEMIDHDVDVVEWYMGEEQFDEFLATEVVIAMPDGRKIKKTGSTNFFFLAFAEHMKSVAAVDAEGNPTMRNRSSRRAAARKQRKQR